MQAQEFMKEKRRMCNAHELCATCPLGHYYRSKYNTSTLKCNSCSITDVDIRQEETIVNHWSQEHPVKTKGDIFIDIYKPYIVVKFSLFIRIFMTREEHDNGDITMTIDRKWWDTPVEE